MRGRKRPYTEKGIERLPCIRCGRKAVHQWQICSDNLIFRPLCMKCDVALNELVLRWIGFKDWRKKMHNYKKLCRT